MGFNEVFDAKASKKMMDLIMWEASPQGRLYLDFMVRAYKWIQRAKRKP